MLLFNLAISTLILAGGVEDIIEVSKLNTKNKGYVFSPPHPTTWTTTECLLPQMAHLVIHFNLHQLHTPLKSAGGFSHGFTFEYGQVRSPFMNWLCPPWSSSPWTRWDTFHWVGEKLDQTQSKIVSAEGMRRWSSKIKSCDRFAPPYIYPHSSY